MTEQHEERYSPLALIGVTLVALLGFAIFFLSFLVAPLAILLIFYVGFAASDRSKRGGGRRSESADEAPEAAPQERAPAGDAADGDVAPAPVTATAPRPQGSAAMLARAQMQRRQTIERSDLQGRDER